MASTAIIWMWSGEAMIPLPRFHNLVNAEFVVGERYRMTVVEERSTVSHGHYFARLHDQWLSLPDHIATQFPTEQVLRKHALIMTGFRKERKFSASSPLEARKLAAWLRPQGPDDDYTIISVNENVVVEWKAVSQSYRDMPETGRFQASKQAVLDWIDDLLGVKPEAASAEAEVA